MSMGMVHTANHLAALTQHVSGRLAVPGSAAVAEVESLMDSGSGITAMSEDDRVLAGTAGGDAYCVESSVRWACACDDIDGSGV